jgi:hypothetical protein
MGLINEIDVISKLISEIRKSETILKPSSTTKKLFINDFKNLIKDNNKEIETQINQTVKHNIKSNKDIIKALIDVDNKVKQISDKINEIENNNKSEHANGIPRTYNDKNKLSILLENNFKVLNKGLNDVIFFLKDELYDIKKSLVSMKNSTTKNPKKEIVVENTNENNTSDLIKKVISMIPKPSETIKDMFIKLGIGVGGGVLLKYLYDNRETIKNIIDEFAGKKFDTQKYEKEMKEESERRAVVESKSKTGNLSITDRVDYISSRKKGHFKSYIEPVVDEFHRNKYSNEDIEIIRNFFDFYYTDYQKKVLNLLDKGMEREEVRKECRKIKLEYLKIFDMNINSKGGIDTLYNYIQKLNILTHIKDFFTDDVREITDKNLDAILEHTISSFETDNKIFMGKINAVANLEILDKKIKSVHNSYVTYHSEWNKEGKNKLFYLKNISKELLALINKQIPIWIEDFYYMGDTYGERIKTLKRSFFQLVDTYYNDEFYRGNTNNELFDKMVNAYFKVMTDDYFLGVTDTIGFDRIKYGEIKIKEDDEIKKEISFMNGKSVVLSKMKTEKYDIDYKVSDFTYGSIVESDVSKLNLARKIFKDFIERNKILFSKLSKSDFKNYISTITSDYKTIVSQIKEITLSDGTSIGNSKNEIFVNFISQIENEFNEIIKQLASINSEIELKVKPIINKSDTEYQREMELKARLITRDENFSNNYIMGSESSGDTPTNPMIESIRNIFKSMRLPQVTPQLNKSIGTDTNQNGDYKDVREMNVDNINLPSRQTSNGRGFQNKNIKNIISNTNIKSDSKVTKDNDTKVMLRKVSNSTYHNKVITKSRNFKGVIPKLI